MPYSPHSSLYASQRERKRSGRSSFLRQSTIEIWKTPKTIKRDDLRDEQDSRGYKDSRDYKDSRPGKAQETIKTQDLERLEKL